MMKPIYPFAWGVDHNNEFVSIPTQRNAKYTKTAGQIFNCSEADAFFSQTSTVTYPQISSVCGIDCPDEGC